MEFGLSWERRLSDDAALNANQRLIVFLARLLNFSQSRPGWGPKAAYIVITQALAQVGLR
jgi:hypothetical protein